MTDTFRSEDPTAMPTIEVSMYWGTMVLRRELVETEADAAALVAHWEESRGGECEVLDLSAETSDHTAGEINWEDPRYDDRPS